MALDSPKGLEASQVESGGVMYREPRRRVGGGAEGRTTQSE